MPAMILLTSEASPFSGAEVGMVALAFGLIVTAMVYTVGKVSGCHINPAVTFALAATKRFPWSGVPAYWAAQVAGGIAGRSQSGRRSEAACSTSARVSASSTSTTT